MEGKGKGNPGCLRIALGCGKTGIRNADYDICLYGISGCQWSAIQEEGQLNAMVAEKVTVVASKRIETTA